MVVIDEAGFNTSMTRTHGRAPRGQRVIADTPVNHGPNVTVLGAMSVDGVLASLAVEGATTTEVFGAFIEKVVAPRLRPGNVVVLDNLSAHKAPAVQAAIEARQAHLVFLPPYSPDFSPIELCWSKVKTRVRQLAARTREALIDALGDALARVRARDARNWFAHCGYVAR